MFFLLAPDGVPLPVTIDVVSTPTSCNITWQPTNNSHPDPDGRILGYKVYYTFNLTTGPRSSTITILGINSSAATLSHLWKYKNYVITVAAFNSYGEGNRSDPFYCHTQEDGRFVKSLRILKTLTTATAATTTKTTTTNNFI